MQIAHVDGIMPMLQTAVNGFIVQARPFSVPDALLESLHPNFIVADADRYAPGRTVVQHKVSHLGEEEMPARSLVEFFDVITDTINATSGIDRQHEVLRRGSVTLTPSRASGVNIRSLRCPVLIRCTTSIHHMWFYTHSVATMEAMGTTIPAIIRATRERQPQFNGNVQPEPPTPPEAARARPLLTAVWRAVGPAAEDAAVAMYIGQSIGRGPSARSPYREWWTVLHQWQASMSLVTIDSAREGSMFPPLDIARVYNIPTVSIASADWDDMVAAAPLRLSPTDDSTPPAWIAFSPALALKHAHWAYSRGNQCQMVAAFKTAPDAHALICTADGLVVTTPGCANSAPAAAMDRTGGQACKGITGSVWMRRPVKHAPAPCKCSICKRSQATTNFGCAVCTAAIHEPRRHAVMGVPMCQRCGTAAGGTVITPTCPSCLQQAGGAVAPCHMCKRTFHARPNCVTGLTFFSSSSTLLVCSNLVCRVAHMPGHSTCTSCSRSLSGSDTPAQCTTCLRVWCQGPDPTCQLAARKPMCCKRCHKLSTKPLRDGDPGNGSRGGNP